MVQNRQDIPAIRRTRDFPNDTRDRRTGRPRKAGLSGQQQTVAVAGSFGEIGKIADFAILAEDPHNVEPDRIKDIPVDMTIVDGREHLIDFGHEVLWEGAQDISFEIV